MNFFNFRQWNCLKVQRDKTHTSVSFVKHIVLAYVFGGFQIDSESIWNRFENDLKSIWNRFENKTHKTNIDLKSIWLPLSEKCTLSQNRFEIDLAHDFQKVLLSQNRFEIDLATTQVKRRTTNAGPRPLRPFLGDLNHHTRTRSDSQDCLLSKFRCRFWSNFEISCRTKPTGRITPPGAVMAVPKGQYVRVWWCLVAKHDFWQFWYLYGLKWSRLGFGAGHATQKIF